MTRYTSLADMQRARSHLTADGREKRRYAPEAARRRADLTGKDCYLCPVCGFWHLGGTKPKRET